MSSFFNNIQKIFLNQTHNDFEKIESPKVHYKDKFFRFDSNNKKYNFLLSSKDDITFTLFQEIMKINYMKIWVNNGYSFTEFGIEKDDLDPKLTYQYIIQNIQDFEYEEEYWIKNWEYILQKDDYYYLNQYLFNDFCYPKIFEYLKQDMYKNDSAILKEYKKYFEVHSITECIKNNMTYKINPEDQPKKFSDLKIFENKIDCTYVMQGSIGTCYFLQAVSILSNYGQLIYQLFPEEEINEEGIYEICLYHEGEWYKILIDDYFLFDKRENENDPLYFTFAKPAKGCLYSCFLEKAFAKIKGGYPDIHGGLSGKAFETLTGFDCLAFPQEKINYDLLRQFKIYLDKGYLIGGHSDGHAYSIIGTENDLDFIIRNPWSSLGGADIYEHKKSVKKKRIKKKNLIQYKDGKFIILKENFQKFFNDGIAVCFCWFGARVYTYKLEKIGIKQSFKALYFTFEAREKIRIAIRLHRNQNNGENESFEQCIINLENLNKSKLYRLKTSGALQKEILKSNQTLNEITNDKELMKGKYLLRIVFLTNNKNKKLKSKLLSIYFNNNVDNYYLGYLEDKPEEDIINNPSKSPYKIENYNYIYGGDTKILFERYKNVIQLMKHLGYEINEGKGMYIETIFTNEIETIILRYKKSNIRRSFTFGKLKKQYYFQESKENGIKTSKNYDFNEVNPIKKSHWDFTHDDLDSEKKDLEIKINLFNYDFEKAINDSDRLGFEEESINCCSNNVIYNLKLNGCVMKFKIINRCLDLFNCLVGEDIIKIDYKEVYKEEVNYANVKLAESCSFNGLIFDVIVNNDQTQEIMGTIQKVFGYSCYNNSIEIKNSEENYKYIIRENGNCSSKFYDIIKENKKDIEKSIKEELVGTIEKINSCSILKNKYDIKFKKRIIYKDKFLIIIGGIIIQI